MVMVRNCLGKATLFMVMIMILMGGVPARANFLFEEVCVRMVSIQNSDEGIGPGEHCVEHEKKLRVGALVGVGVLSYAVVKILGRDETNATFNVLKHMPVVEENDIMIPLLQIDF